MALLRENVSGSSLNNPALGVTMLCLNRHCPLVWESFSKTLQLLKMSEYFLLVGQILCPTNDELREGVAFGFRILPLAE
jgi:hypothetical protein